MRILITTGVFEPESGGPATYAPKLASRLTEQGWEVTVLTYSNELSYDADTEYPFKLVRILRTGGRLRSYFRFLRTTWQHAKGKDLIYTLDWIAAGLPVSIVARMKRIPYIVRMGGDYAWEQKYLESGTSPLPLRDFYTKGLYKNYRTINTILRFVLGGACRVVFTSSVQRELYETYLGLPSRKGATIYNPIPRSLWNDIVRTSVSEEVVFAGRLIVMKNVETLLQAFKKAHLPDTYTLLIIGDGPQEAALRHLADELGLTGRVSFLPGMRQRELYERIKDCRAIVLPSWTDISSNQVCEALSLHIPIIATQETYLPMRDQLPETIDPRSVDDVAAKLEMLTDDERYAAFCSRLDAVSFAHDWDDVLKAHLALFAECLGTNTV